MRFVKVYVGKPRISECLEVHRMVRGRPLADNEWSCDCPICKPGSPRSQMQKIRHAQRLRQFRADQVDVREDGGRVKYPGVHIVEGVYMDKTRKVVDDE